MRTIVAILAILMAGGALAQAYKWVDANGVVHYSDRPQPGAEEIQLPQSGRSNTFNRRAVSPAVQPETQDDDANQPEPPFAYESIEITAPSPEETLWNIEGTLDVVINVQPALRQEHSLRVFFDGGEPITVRGSRLQIPDVFRGVHNIQAEIRDENGELMGRSLPNRFYVQQNSVISAN